jgi:hypothetical protein
MDDEELQSPIQDKEHFDSGSLNERDESAGDEIALQIHEADGASDFF